MKNQFFCNFFNVKVFFNSFCLTERKLQLQRLNVINKEIKPFEKEFYNLLNLTNLPQGDLQLNGGDCPGGNFTGVNCLGGNYTGGIVWGAIGMGVNCSGGNSPGGY